MPPKSILKKSSSASKDADKDAALRERHLATALHHANLIQQQKDVEKLIVDSVLELLELPSKPDADPALPSPEDAAEFKRLVAVFEPHDYDEYIEERVVSKLCGYGLCSRPPLKDEAGGKYKIVCSNEHGLKILPRSKVELWCSQACARRALYIKVQLSEEPAAARRAGLAPGIELLNESQHASESKPVDTSTGLEDSVRKMQLGTDEAGSHESSSNILASEVVEKRVRMVPVPPSLADGGSTHTMIEGHATRDLASQRDHGENGQVDDEDWDI